MDTASALAEFAALLQIGASSLKAIVASASPDVVNYLQEIDEIADRLNEIGNQIADAKGDHNEL